MSSNEKRYDKSAPWNTQRSESGSRNSPERYRNRSSDSLTRRYNSQNDRRYYNNRTWTNPHQAKRNSYDHNRYRYDRRPETSDAKKQHEGEKSDAPSTERESRNLPSLMDLCPWSSSSSSHVTNAMNPGAPPPTSPWIRGNQPWETNAAPCGSENSTQTNSDFFFGHLNKLYGQNSQSRLVRPMSFIDKLIADEAMRMLSAASSSEATSLNEPCETAEAVPSNAPASKEAESSKQEKEKAVSNGSNIDDEVVTISATNSALLQKSAEQVTKKLINQLSTMSKYDLKHMIDNPAGKYETALNRHAQSKLRNEVRKQLKSFNLGKLGSSCVTDDGTVESDEAIDADKIPSALLEQIGQVLDMDFFDLPPTESSETIEQLPNVMEHLSPNTIEHESKDEHREHDASTCSTAVSIDEGTAVPTKISPRNKNSFKPSTPSIPGRGSKMIIRLPKATITERKVAREAVASSLQANATKPLPKHNPSVLASNNACEDKRKNISWVLATSPAVIPPVQSLKYVSQIGKATRKDTDMEMPKRNSLDIVNPLPGNANSNTKNVSLLRVSTVEELNRRLDEHSGTKNVESLPISESDLSNILWEEELTWEDASNACEQSASLNAKQDAVPSTTDGICNTNSTNHSCDEMLILGGESNAETGANDSHWQSAQSRNNTCHQTHSPALSTVQRQEQLNSSNNVQLQSDSSNGFAPLSTPVNQPKPVHNQNAVPGAKKSTKTPPVGKDRPMASVKQAQKPVLSSPSAQLSVKKRNRPKKRKHPKNNNCMPSTAQKRVASNDTTDSVPTKVLKMTEASGIAVANNGQLIEPSCTAKSKRQWKQNKASRFGTPINAGNANKAADESGTSVTDRIPSLSMEEEIPNENHLLNNDYDLHLGKSSIDRAPKHTVEQQNHITIASVCSIAGSEEVSTSASSTTVNAAIEETAQKSPDFQQTQEEFPATPKDETTTPTIQHPEQSLPNFEPTESCADEHQPDCNLPLEETIMESKEGIERIASPQPSTGDKPSDEYILGGDSSDNCLFSPTLSDGSLSRPVEQQAPLVGNHSASPLPPTPHAARLQSLCGVTEHMQSVEAQAMALHNRKIQIDAMFMQLHAERMDIDRELERLHHIRSEQLNFLRFNLHELASTANGSTESIIQPPSFVMADSGTGSTNGIPANQTGQPGQLNTQTGGRQQERTIRRITPIGGNSVLMKIFQRRRAPSERSTEENPPVVEIA